MRHVDRDVDEQVGFDFGPKPKVWRVYERNRKKGKKKNDDMEGLMHGMHEVHVHGTSAI
jgi:hypothetical protein